MKLVIQHSQQERERKSYGAQTNVGAFLSDVIVWVNGLKYFALKKQTLHVIIIHLLSLKYVSG